ncbi:DUF6249 domain-containing protein [Bacteroides reticulotermitis]|uniref:DUF6249 domain-containing protein n=1 Tax=Bacteroides reticulotermitis TaxID=1133319 RepID=UPI003A89EE02
MKQILLALAVILALCLPANAQKTTVIQDSIGKVKITVSKTNSGKTTTKNTAVTVVGVDPADADADIDALADTINSDEEVDDSTSTSKGHGKASFSFDLDNDDSDSFPFPIWSGQVLIPIVAIIAVFGMPVFILFVVFFFRYKNRKARYRLAEQALAAGQPLPEGLFKGEKIVDSRSKGIQNTFTGIGLFIFLWAITGEFGVGCIGLLVMFMGIGQWLIGMRKDGDSNNAPFIHIDNDEKTGKSKIKFGGIEINNTEKEDEQK